MTKSILQFTLLFIVLILAQVLVFNRIYLFDTAFPLAFIYFIIKLPVTLGSISVMTLSFALGLTVDIFSDTAGMNALACTILAAVRTPILRLYVPREEDLTNPEPSIKSLGVSAFTKYALSISLAYCLLFFFIESFTIAHFTRLITRALGSSILTFIIILCIDYLTNQRSEKRL